MPLSSHSDFKPFVRTLSDRLAEAGVSTRVDDSGASIGKRYSVSVTDALSGGRQVANSSNSATTSWARPWASQSTSSRSRTTRSRCATVTRRSRCVGSSRRLRAPSSAWSTARRSGPMLQRACPSLRARRSRLRLGKTGDDIDRKTWSTFFFSMHGMACVRGVIGARTCKRRCCVSRDVINPQAGYNPGQDGQRGRDSC